MQEGWCNRGRREWDSWASTLATVGRTRHDLLTGAVAVNWSWLHIGSLPTFLSQCGAEVRRSRLASVALRLSLHVCQQAAW